MSDETRHLVGLSFGKDSTALALRLREVYPKRTFEYIYTPTGNELPEMIEHILHVQELLGTKLTPVTIGRSLMAESRHQRMLPNSRARWCTRILKIIPFQAFVASAMPCVIYIGIRADEADRKGVEYEEMGEGVTTRYPFVEWDWGIGDVWEYLDDKGVKVPERTDCAMCFFQRLGEWWRLWKDHPDEYQKAVQLEDDISEMHGKKCTLRSDSRDTWPAALKDLRAEFERGRIPKGAADQDLDLGVYSRSKMCSFCAR